MEEKKESKQNLTPEQEVSLQKHQINLISYSITTLFGIVLMVLIPTLVKLKKKADFGPEKFPQIIAGFFIVLGAIGLILELRALRKEDLRLTFPKIDLKKYLTQVVMVAAGLLFIACAKYLGFLPASILFVFAMLFLFGSRSWKFNLLFAVVYGILIFILFSKILGIRFIGGLISF